MSYIGGPITIPNASRIPMPPGGMLGNAQGFSDDEKTGPTTLIKLPNGEIRRVPTKDGSRIDVVVNEVPNNTELVEDTSRGIMVGKNRPLGLFRPLASAIDWISGDSKDLDQLGSGTGVAHPVTGAGGIIEGFENTKKGITKIPDKTVAKDPDFSDFYGMDFQEYLNKMEGIQDRAANKKMLRGQIASIPDLMAAGNLAVAQANRDIAKASSEWGVALTKQKPWEAVQKWSPPTQFDYRLGS